MRRRRAVVTLVALASAATVATFATQGCSLITSYDGFATSSAATAPCGARIPGPPNVPITNDNGDVRRGALKAIHFAAPDNKQPTLGFDLDENCSMAACISYVPPKKGAPPKVGVDNAIGGFIGGAVAGGQSDAVTDAALKDGTFGLVVEVTKWNQQPNDSAVTVSLYNVVGINPGGSKANFAGNDAFVVDQSEIKTGSLAGSTHQDIKAYVTNGTLVAHFPTFPLRLIAKAASMKLGILSIAFTEASLVGTVKAVTNGVEMIGAQLVGRIEQVEILEDISRLGYCKIGPDGGSESYEADKGLVCSFLDLTSSHTTDGKGQRCSAGSVSFGMDFVGTSVAPTPGPARAVLNECPGDPAGDSCGQ